MRAKAIASAIVISFGNSGCESPGRRPYPQIDVTGYKEYTYSKASVDNEDNLLAAETLLGGYYAAGPWQEKLKLGIVGKLTDKLSVSYDLEQQPDIPDKFNVKVDYDRTELSFGDLQANFNDNEFTSTSKSLNGVMITSSDNWYNTILVPSSKLQSQTQSLVSQNGEQLTGKGPYNLGHGSIIEGSERIYLNGVLLQRGTDYTMDYFSGTITFSRQIFFTDVFKYSYEFTNLIDQFFPTTSQRDFVGIQADVTVDPSLLGAPSRKIEKAIKRGSDYFPALLEIPGGNATKEAPDVTIGQSTKEAGAFTVFINKIPVIQLHNISGEVSAQSRAEDVQKRLLSLFSTGITTSEIINSSANSAESVTAKGQNIVTASKAEAQLNNITEKELALQWKNSMIAALMAPAPTPEAAEVPEEQEWESTGTYKLKNAPIIPYSEKITYMGTQLKKFEDYLINYQDGTVTYLRPNLPSAEEPLVVEYDYVEVATESETLPGSGKGPYSLAHKGLIEGSETIYVNNIPYMRELDYKIDYAQGKVMFITSIPTTANIVLKYKYIVLTAPPAPVSTGVPKTLTVGVTYLKESGKKSAAAPTQSGSDSFSGGDIANIISRNNAIFLTNYPLTTTESITVTKNGSTLAYGTDWTVPVWDGTKLSPEVVTRFVDDPADQSDGLQLGIIALLTTPESGDNITVNYEYSQWSVNQFNGDGNSAIGPTPSPIVGAMNMVRGAEQVTIRTKDLLIPNGQSVPVYRNTNPFTTDRQYSINYTDPNPTIKFNNDPLIIPNPNGGGTISIPLSDIYFTVLYRFVAQASSSNQSIEHDVAGITSSFKVGDFLSLNGSYAKSTTDQVFQTSTTSETFGGNTTPPIDGVSKVITLHSSGTIIDGT